MSKQDRAAAILKGARADLGEDLSGWSAVDLLLDNMPDVVDPDEARSILEALEDPSPDDEPHHLEGASWKPFTKGPPLRTKRGTE